MEIDLSSNVEEMLRNLSFNEKIIFNLNNSKTDPMDCSNKYDVIKASLEKSPSLFLEKYYKYLNYETHGLIFNNLATDDQSVAFYLDKLKNYGNPVNVKNRRFKKLSNLLEEGKYFSHEQMKNRQPLLYSRYIENVLSNKEQEEKLGRCYDTFSGFLMNNMLFREDRFRKNEDIKKEEKILENSNCIDNCDSEEEMEDEDEVSDEESVNFKCSSDDKRFLEDEFLSIMKYKFLNGEDDYNYSEVDNDSTLDDLEEITRDLEERYFEEEDPIESSVSQQMDDRDDDFIEYKARDKLNKYLSQ